MKKLIALMLTAAFCSGAAIAQETMGANEEFDFATADSDGDGKLARSEVSAQAQVSSNFESWDSNGDGFLDKNEVETGMATNSGADYDAVSGEETQDDGMGSEYEPISEEGVDNGTQTEPLFKDSTQETTQDDTIQQDDSIYEPVSDDAVPPLEDPLSTPPTEEPISQPISDESSEGVDESAAEPTDDGQVQ